MENETVVEEVEDTVINADSLVDEITTQAEPIFSALSKYFTLPFLLKLLGTLFILVVLYLLYRVARSMVKRVPEKNLKTEYKNLIQKVLMYVYYTISCVYILGLFGINLSVVWGAAGVAGVAIGFAAQTSVSNIISGLFVVSDRAMKEGDLITIDGITGNVDSIDLISVKVKTLDNQLVRIPNSTIINSDLINTTFFPQRRMTIQVSVDYDSDLEKALEVLKTVPDLCPTVLKEPAPAVWIDSFGDSGVNMTLAVWFKKEDSLATKNAAFIGIHKAFGKAGINIPFNRFDVTVLNEDTVPAKTVLNS